MNFTELPEDVIARVLEIVPAVDVSRVKRTSKHLHGMIKRYHLGRPKVEELSVEQRVFEVPLEPLGRLQYPRSGQMKKRMVFTMRKAKISKRVVEDLDVTSSSESDHQMIGEALRNVQLAERLSFDGVLVNQSFYKMFTSPWNDLSDVKSLSFTLSQIYIDENQLITFIDKAKLESLSFDFCVFHKQVITDQVLSRLSSIRALRVQPRSITFLPEVTDCSLQRWNETAPSVISFYNCVTNFTLGAVAEMIKALPKAAVVDWDFGRLLRSAQTDSAFACIALLPGIVLQINDDFHSKRIEISRGKSKIAFNILTERMYTN